MTLQELKKMLTGRNEDHEFQMFIAEVNKNDELRAEAYANRSTYVNPGELRFGGKQVNKENALSSFDVSGFCPA
jgi:hypothetical protein